MWACMKAYKKEKVCPGVETSGTVTVRGVAREFRAGASVQLPARACPPAAASKPSVPTPCKALCQVLAQSVGQKQEPGQGEGLCDRLQTQGSLWLVLLRG